MANIPSQNPWNNPRDVRPYDPNGNPFAEFGSAAGSQPPRSGSGCMLWIVLGGIGMALVAFATVLVLVGVWAGRTSSGDSYSWQQLQQQAAAAFTTLHQEPPPGRSAEDVQLRSDVEQLMQRIERAARHDDRATFADCVNVRRYTQRMGKLSRQPLLHWQPLVRREVASHLSVSPEWSRLMLVEVVRASDSLCFAYTYGWGDEDQVEIRWWLIEDGEGWKVYDWQRLDLGMSEAEHWAEVMRLSHRDLQLYEQAVQRMETSDQLYTMGEFDEAIDLLSEIRPDGLPNQLADFIWLNSAYRLRRLGEMEMSREYSQRVNNADRWPGSHFNLMEQYRTSGDYEKALHHGRQYEALLGPSPALNTALAEIHQMRGEHDEAIAQWQKVLRIEPDSHALDWLVAALPVDRLETVLSWLERNEHAYEMLRRLAPRFSYSAPEKLARLSEFANEHHRDTAVAAYLTGLQHQRDYDDDEAARYFQVAFQAASDAEDTTSFLHAYLDAMTWTGRAAEAYRQLEDDAVFDYYVDDFEYFGDIDRRQFREVLAEHRRRRPDDPRGYYHAGVLARQERQYDEAERQLREALRLADNEEEPLHFAEMIRHELTAVLDATGRWQEAYALHESAEQFQQLADIMQQQQRGEDLEALIDLHSASHPDDSWLDLYRGMLLLEQGYFAPAVVLWKESKASLPDTDNELNDALQWRIQQQLRQAYLDDGLWRDAYQNASDRETAFADIARDLQFREAWEALEQLIVLHEQSHPEDPEVIQQRSELLWGRGDYSGYVEHLRDEVVDGLDLESWRRAGIHSRRVRALLRLGRFEEARRLADQLADRDQSYLLQTIVPIVQGDVAEATRTVREALEDEHVYIVQLFTDEDAGPRLWEAEFAELRREIVPELPYSLGTTLAGVLLREPQSLSPQDVQPLIADRFDEPGEVRLVTELPAHLDRAVTVRIGDFTLWFATGRPAQPLDQRALERILPANNDHEAEAGMWLFAGVASWHSVPSEAGDAGWHVVSRLAQDNALAVLLPSTEGLLPADESTLAALPDSTRRLSLAGRALPAYAWSESEESRSTERQFDRQLHLLAQDFLAGDREPPLEVCFHVDAGLLREKVWLRVEEIDRPVNYRFAGRLLEDSRLIPRLRQDEPLRLEQFEVAAWRRGQEAGMRSTSGRTLSQ